MKYTQGEWSFDPNESEFSDKHYIFCPAGKTICSIFGPHDDPEDEANGNALLIAAAPELLEALINIANRMGQMNLDYELPEDCKGIVCGELDAANIVISKATGEQL